MPEISRFYGVRVSIQYREHGPPHFHARYGSDKISVRIADGHVTGRFPKRALRFVLEWYDLHRDELSRDWDLARQGRPLRPIPPLE